MDASNTPITATLVDEMERLAFLPTHFGPHLMLRGETLVYVWLSKLCDQYRGGFWNYYTLSNGGFYLAPDLEGPLVLDVVGNDFHDELSADAAGIVATWFAFGQLIPAEKNSTLRDLLVDRYHALREYATTHAEGELILAAID